jgi:structural maintenance of chromosome 4
LINLEKTHVYQVQIEAKQTELAPWLEKINEKKGQVDVIASEIEILDVKVNSGKEGLKYAEENLKVVKKKLNECKESVSALKTARKEIALQGRDSEGLLEVLLCSY